MRWLFKKTRHAPRYRDHRITCPCGHRSAAGQAQRFQKSALHILQLLVWNNSSVQACPDLLCSQEGVLCPQNRLLNCIIVGLGDEAVAQSSLGCSKGVIANSRHERTESSVYEKLKAVLLSSATTPPLIV